MARVSDDILPDGEWYPGDNPDGTQMGLTLDRYAELLGWGTNGFNGVNRPEDVENVECDDVWKQSSRDRIAIAIVQAEIMREQEVMYHIGQKFETDEYTNPYNPLELRWKHLIEVGDPTVTTISAGVVIDHGAETDPNDPVVLSVASTVAAAEVKIYYPGENVEITPSSITTDGATLTIRIPRARLVKPELNDDREDPLSYYENDNFLETVDVRRFYLDPTNACEYIWRNPCSACSTDCTVQTQQACWRITSPRAYRLATLYLEPATYTASTATWETNGWSYCDPPDTVRITYKSGKKDLHNMILTARLAHTLMPYCPCDCKAVDQTWQDDRLTVPRVWTPYGNRSGAVMAWTADSRKKMGAGGKFPRAR